MCHAFSCIVTEQGEVYYKVGMDSHDLILDKFKIREMDDEIDKSRLKFARVEITPMKGYLYPESDWHLQIDERIKPDWWSTKHKEKAFTALGKWKKKVYSSFNLEKARNPLNPLLLSPGEITIGDIDNLKRCVSVRALVGDSVGDSVWDSVGASVGDSVRDSVGDSVWASVGDSVGDSVRDSVGDSVRDSVGDSVRDSVGDSVWASVRDSVGDSVWDLVGDSVWASVRTYTGSMFPNIKKWKYIKTPKGEYPYQCYVNLWERGFVPSFDGQTWRLHAGKEAQIVYELKEK